jgi:hypothetical protein
MTLEDLIRILHAVAPVLAVMLVIAWILFWLEKKGQHLPHSYSTASRHKPASGETRKCAVANCSICGEGR